MKLFFSPEFVQDITQLSRHQEKTGKTVGSPMEFFISGEEDGVKFTKLVSISQSGTDGMLTVEFTK